MKKPLLLLAIFMTLLSVNAFATDGTWVEFPICTNSASQMLPDIYGDIVVWADNFGGTLNIWGYDLSTSTQFPISLGSVGVNNGDPHIYENIVVYSKWQAVTDDVDVYGYDLATQTEFPITTAEGMQSDAHIFGSIVVWEDGRSPNSGIYGFDLSTESEFPIHIGAAGRPDIYGNIVVWCDRRNGNGDIYGYDLTTRNEFPICTHEAEQIDPAIYGDIVVWTDSRGNGGIFAYDLTRQTEFQIPTTFTGQQAPDIYGDIVVWYQGIPPNYDIYGFDLSTSTEFPISTSVGAQLYPAIYENTVVWRDDRKPGGIDDDIYGAKFHPIYPPALSGCINEPAFANAEVILILQGEKKQVTTADANGCYEFYDLDAGQIKHLQIKVYQSAE